ncbi:hypothetical protein WIW50_05735 [Flavobacteriaceae bacterium 3-367]
MKAINRNRVLTTIQRLKASLLLVLVLVACSKSDEGEAAASINVQASTFLVENVNTCSTSLGAGTVLSFKTPYSTSQNLTIQKMLIKTTVSNGESKDATNTKFTDTGENIEWVSCFTFGSQDWVEYEVRLESTDGSVSNVSKVRVNKPSGAN